MVVKPLSFRAVVPGFGFSTGSAAVPAKSGTNAVSEVGVQTRKGPLGSPIAKQALQGLVFAVSGAEPISMPHQALEPFVFDSDGVGMDGNTEFVGEVASGPHVVVAEVPMDVQPTIHELTNAAEQANRTFGHDMLPFEPEVQHVTHQVKPIASGAHFVDPLQERAFPVA